MDDLRQLLPAPLAAQAARLRRLTACLYRTLPGELVAHCEVIGLEAGILTLGVESPAWQTRLRFMQAEILGSWPGDQEPIHAIKLRVIYAPTPHERPRRQALPLPQEAASALRQSAEREEHAGLSAALMRLAQRATERKD